jgi:ArsR family transcriptional regulator, arsenate/arsenite/antimonite-responsive transcriptional repressor
MMKRVERMFKALADPTRLRILNILFSGETCVCELQRILNLPQPLLSRHLTYLRNAGIVQDRRDGPRVFYSLTLENENGQSFQQLLKSVLPRLDICKADRKNMRRLAGSSAKIPPATGGLRA